MSVFLDISAALDDHLNNMVGLPSGVAWENRPFEPATGTLWIRPKILPGDSVQASLGDNGFDSNIGVYQVDIFAEPGKGKNEAVTMADTIASHFKRGTDLTYNSRVVTIKNVNQLAGINNKNGWYQIPIEIVYYSYTTARV